MEAINNIYSKHLKDRWAFAGDYISDKKFLLGDNVFFSAYSGVIFNGRILGISFARGDESKFEYKIEVPQALVDYAEQNFPSPWNADKISVPCNLVFSSPEEARDSAVMELERTYTLSKEEISRYFSQFGVSDSVNVKVSEPMSIFGRIFKSFNNSKEPNQ